MAIPAGIMERFRGAIKIGRLYLRHQIALTAAGSTQTDALQLKAIVNRLDTVSSGTGVKLPPLEPSRGPIVVHNNTTTTAQVYSKETSGAAIVLSSGSVAGSTGVALSGHKTMVFFACEGAWFGGSLGT